MNNKSFRRFLLASLMGMLISSLAFGVDIKSQIGTQDLNVDTDGAAHGTFQRRTSTGGTITLDKIDGNQIPWSLDYSRTIRPGNITGNSTGRIQNYSIGSASYTDNGYFGDLITRGPWVDVRAYLPAGFVTDGSVDYSAQVSTTINALAAGSTLLVPIPIGLGTAGWAGITITNKSNITIMGLGNGGFKVLALPSGTPRVFTFALGDSITIKNLRFDRNNFAVRFIQFDGNSDLELSNNYFFGATSVVASTVPLVHWASDTDGRIGRRIKVFNNTFDMSGCGYYVLYFGLNKNVYVEGITFQGNIISNTYWGTIVAWGNGISIVGNVVDNVISGPAYNVSQDTDPSPNTGRNIVISGNISRNVNGGIHLDSMGDYFNNVTISNNMFDNTTGTSATISAIHCHNCSIVGNTIKNGAYRGIFSGYKSRNVLISSNTIDNVANAGIGIDAQTYADNIIVIGNITTKNETGININSDNTINNLIISNNAIGSSTAYGIFLTGSGVMTGVNVSNNTVIGGQYGIYNNNIVKVRQLWGSNNRFTGQSIGANNGATFVEYDSTTGKVYSRGTAAPTDNTVTWAIGDTVWNTAGDNVIGWKCTTAGSPGTWGAMTVTMP